MGKQKIVKQAEAEVVPSSSSVEVDVEVDVGVEVEVEVGVEFGVVVGVVLKMGFRLRLGN